MVCDWRMQMFLVREEYVTTLESKIHVSAERFIQCWSLRQPSRLPTFHRQTRSLGDMVSCSTPHQFDLTDACVVLCSRMLVDLCLTSLMRMLCCVPGCWLTSVWPHWCICCVVFQGADWPLFDLTDAYVVLCSRVQCQARFRHRIVSWRSSGRSIDHRVSSQVSLQELWGDLSIT